MKNECLICRRIQQIQNGTNPYFVTELETGYVVLGDYQFYKGYTLFLAKNHVTELHELAEEERKVFLYEMSLVAKAVYEAFHPAKLNYELLGNTDPHLHWHLFPRYHNDPLPDKAVWLLDKHIRCNEGTKPTSEELGVMKKRLRERLG